MKIYIAPQTVPLKSQFLKEHFSSDVVSSTLIRNAYESTQRVLLDPALYPKADFNYLHRLDDELINASPSSCFMGDE
jgi:hypothetical protein